MGDTPPEHPILRFPATVRYKPWVVIGHRNLRDYPDEVWTRSSAVIQGIHEALDSDLIFTDSEWQRDIIARASLGDRPASVVFAMPGSARGGYVTRSVEYPSEVVERVFRALALDGVLRHATPSEIRMRTLANARSNRHWIVDTDKLEEWTAVRLLLLSDRQRDS